VRLGYAPSASRLSEATQRSGFTPVFYMSGRDGCRDGPGPGSHALNRRTDTRRHGGECRLGVEYTQVDCRPMKWVAAPDQGPPTRPANLQFCSARSPMKRAMITRLVVGLC